MLSVQLLDISGNGLIDAEIVPAKGISMPLRKDGWHFNWRTMVKEKGVETYVLRTTVAQTVEGVLSLKLVNNEMLLMDVLEIAPHNVGRKNKRYDDVAGCLIAFACRKSFELTGANRGFLAFVSKTNLIGWYIYKYGAEQAMRQNMFIAPEQGLKLINSYLVREDN